MHGGAQLRTYIPQPQEGMQAGTSPAWKLRQRYEPIAKPRSQKAIESTSLPPNAAKKQVMH